MFGLFHVMRYWMEIRDQVMNFKKIFIFFMVAEKVERLLRPHLHADANLVWLLFRLFKSLTHLGTL